MGTLFTVITIVFVVAVLLIVGYVFFEVSPIARHVDVYRKRGERQKSPRLD
jgi:hypothetical protein